MFANLKENSRHLILFLLFTWQSEQPRHLNKDCSWKGLVKHVIIKYTFLYWYYSIILYFHKNNACIFFSSYIRARRFVIFSEGMHLSFGQGLNIIFVMHQLTYCVIQMVWRLFEESGETVRTVAVFLKTFF